MKPPKYLPILPNLFGTRRTKEILKVNPTVMPQREEAQEVSISVFEYNAHELGEHHPATVIGGIFGMNFDVIPYIHNRWGFFVAVGLMLLIPIWMLMIFRRRGWF